MSNHSCTAGIVFFALALFFRRRNAFPLMVVFFVAIVSAAPAESKQIKLVNSYQTNGLTWGRAIQTTNGLIWFGTIDGLLRRLDPKVSNRIVSEHKLKGGVQLCLNKMSDLNGKEIVVVGHSGGLSFYSAEGEEIADISGERFAIPPIEWQGNWLFMSMSGALYRLDSHLKLTKVPSVNIGIPTSGFGLIRNPKPVVVFGAKRASETDMVRSDYLIAHVPLSDAGNSTGVLLSSDLPSAVRRFGKLIIEPTVVTTAGIDKAYVVTNKGKVLSADQETVKLPPIIDLKYPARSPVIQLDNNRFCVFVFDTVDSLYSRNIFTSDGTLISKTSIRDKDHAMSAIPTSSPLIFNFKNENLSLLQGFADHKIRLIDLESGSVEASFTTAEIVSNTPCKLNDDLFFITERSGELPDEKTNHYLVEISD